jgi:isoquinoline 1-oxidoreductase
MWSREEELTWAYFRPAAVIDVRSGAGTDGALTAWGFTNINSGAAGILCPYEIPNQRIDFRPADSPLRQGSYRALAATANHFARESHMDELAHELGTDPLELRLRHLADDRLADVFTAAAERAGWERRPGDRGHGLGIAGGVEKDARVATCVEVRVDADGRVEVVRIVTAFDCGAIVNPEGLENQIEGATVMGLGGALFEAIHFRDGSILNPSLSRYRVPRFSDVPAIEVVLLDRRDMLPAGAGETPIVAVAPALANAIHAATGRRIRSMPLAPDGVLR